MSRRPTVLLHIDERQRDVHIIYWISFWLEKYGFKTYFCNRANRDLFWETIKPDIMLDSHFNYYDLKKLEYRSIFTKFCVLPAEGAIFNDNIITWLYFSRYETNEQKSAKSNYLAKTFLWSDKAKDTFIKTGLFNEGQLVVVGNPHYDVYMKKNVPKERSKLGILSMFKGINIFDNRNYLQFYDSMRNHHGTHYAENRNVEDLIWYYTCGFRVTRDLLDYLMADGNFEVLLRPHHNENACNYEYLEKKFPKRFKLEYKIPFFKWIQQVYAVILCKSTTIAEAIIAGKPVICIEKLMGNRIDDHMNLPDNRIPLFMKYTWQPKDYEEAVVLCKKAKEGKLPLTPDDRGLMELINDYFGYPRKLPATFIIAREIAQLYSNNHSFFKRKKKRIISVNTIKSTLKLEYIRFKYFIKKWFDKKYIYNTYYPPYRFLFLFTEDGKESNYLKDFWVKNIYSKEYESEIRKSQILH